MDFSEYGNPAGKPVVYFHGVPGSPSEASVFDAPAREQGLRILCFDRFAIDHAITATSLTSAATDPTYAGALSFMRRRYGKDLSGVDVAVLGIPFDAAVSNRPGARFGPQAIRRASASSLSPTSRMVSRLR